MSYDGSSIEIIDRFHGDVCGEVFSQVPKSPNFSLMTWCTETFFKGSERFDISQNSLLIDMFSLQNKLFGKNFQNCSRRPFQVKFGHNI